MSAAFSAPVFFLISAVTASAAFITNPAILNANDSVSWSQLGDPGSAIPPLFTAVSMNGIHVAGALSSGGGGTVAQVCPAASCNFAGAPGFNPEDFLFWTEDANGNGTGPLSLTFQTPLRGVGFYLQLTSPGSFIGGFTVNSGPNAASEFPASDSSGDPLFVGALDSAADITGITVGMSACTPASPGICSPSDFAIDRVSLATNVPEPGCFVLVFAALVVFNFRRLKPAMVPGLLGGVILLFFIMPIRAQDREANTATGPPGLPTWRYQITSPVDGLSYSGYMVGYSPFNRGARSATIPVILVPFIVKFTNTTSGFTATFDPSSAPDTGCTAGQTALSLVENSPIFQNYDWVVNGVDVGHTQYVDALQRANFWQYVQRTGNAYHTLLSYTVGDPLTLTLSYAAPTLLAEIRTGVAGPCTNPTGSGSTNAGSYEGIVNFDTLNNAMRNYIAAHTITPNQFPIFILYNVMYSQNNLLYLGGFHFSETPYPQSLTTPGQTFAMANFRTNGTGPFDVSILSHEIAEWINDPGGTNPVPHWGSIGEVTGCRNDLEVGDPLTRTDIPPIAGPNGFAYHLQEMAFFSWFFRTPPIGAGGMFSSNGTLTTDAGAVCH